ncbi:MAG: serine protease [Leptospiraceae bacterium]|nr:serine protease [Leptospiraceae bacterium]MDW7975092.1 serine protease [Leptospiraceae bacterium]
MDKKFFVLLFLIFSFCHDGKSQIIDYEDFKKYVVSIHYTNAGKPNGTGFLLSDGKTILTCEHVIKNWENSLFVSYFNEDSKFYPAKVLGKDEKKDLALLQVVHSLKTQRIPFKEKLKVGEEVFAFGSMYGFSYTLLKGYVSHPLREEVDYTRLPHIHVFGLAYSGMSGAPVFSQDGYFIGLIRGVFGFGIDNGNSMVIPISTIRDFLREHKIEY